MFHIALLLEILFCVLIHLHLFLNGFKLLNFSVPSHLLISSQNSYLGTESLLQGGNLLLLVFTVLVPFQLSQSLSDVLALLPKLMDTFAGFLTLNLIDFVNLLLIFLDFGLVFLHELSTNFLSHGMILFDRLDFALGVENLSFVFSFTILSSLTSLVFDLLDYRQLFMDLHFKPLNFLRAMMNLLGMFDSSFELLQHFYSLLGFFEFQTLSLPQNMNDGDSFLDVDIELFPQFLDLNGLVLNSLGASHLSDMCSGDTNPLFISMDLSGEDLIILLLQVGEVLLHSMISLSQLMEFLRFLSDRNRFEHFHDSLDPTLSSQ